MADDDLAQLVRDELDGLTAAAPPLGFSAVDVLAKGRARRRTRRLGLAAGSSVAASLAAVGAVLAVSIGAGGAGVVPAAGPPAASVPRPAPAATTPAPPKPTPPFGLSGAEARGLVKECAAAYGSGRSISVTITPPAAPDSKEREIEKTDLVDALGAVTVYNVRRDEGGMVALLYGPNLAMICALDLRREVVYSNVTWQWAVPGLIGGPVAIDAQEAYITKTGRPYAGYDVVAGRVARQIAHVRINLNGHAVEIEPSNGTYVARVPRDANEYVGQPPAWVQGVDQNGRPVGAANTMAQECLFADGRVVLSTAPRNCRPTDVWTY
jgi:hypothetical protein